MPGKHFEQAIFHGPLLALPLSTLKGVGEAHSLAAVSHRAKAALWRGSEFRGMCTQAPGLGMWPAIAPPLCQQAGRRRPAGDGRATLLQLSAWQASCSLHPGLQDAP